MRRRLTHGALVALASLPLAGLALDAWRGQLEAEPIKQVTHVTGLWTLRLLLASLAITPARQILGLGWLAPYRRTLGLLAFSYCTLHLLTYGVLDLWGDWGTLFEDIAKRPYITVGFAGFLCLVPLAITSTRAWIRRLGKRWVVLHRLVYVAAVCGCVHFLWLVKKDVREPLIYSALLTALFAARGFVRLRPRFAAATKARKSASLSASP
ncbi:MAG TPA: protein-methionine-sulfoxide reductase heme-binding subunit MsrQ [Myxococcota bacterium]|nr:protein-methionine-sulfoxide reductase heme-binding subunit MsrQ [Myxococcota bacterium]